MDACGCTGTVPCCHPCCTYPRCPPSPSYMRACGVTHAQVHLDCDRSWVPFLLMPSHAFSCLLMPHAQVHLDGDRSWVPFPRAVERVGWSSSLSRLPALLERLANMSDAELTAREAHSAAHVHSSPAPPRLAMASQHAFVCPRMPSHALHTVPGIAPVLPQPITRQRGLIKDDQRPLYDPQRPLYDPYK